MQLVIILALALLVSGLVENYLHQKNLRHVPVRVLVNGTRGKSTVTRLIAGALREAGVKTIAKTTGSAANIIFEDGSETPVKRPFGARITEQKALARLAARRGAEALVAECMAVRPDSQDAMRRHLVRPTVCVITNARIDHIEEMGPSEEDTVAALSRSVPGDCALVTTDRRFAGLAKRFEPVDASAIGEAELERFSYPVFAENVALALKAAEILGVDRETALRGMAAAKPDIGALGIFDLETKVFRAVFVNGFAANDLESTALVWEKVRPFLPRGWPVALVFNNRDDREYRAAEFPRLPAMLGNVRLAAVVGARAARAAKAFSVAGTESFAADRPGGPENLFAAVAERIGGPFVAFGVGNIGGSGGEIAAYCAERGVPRRIDREAARCCENR